MIDGYGRKLSVLRLIITLKCNYNCIFCHREGQINNAIELPAEAYGVIAEAASMLGVTSFKLTGGEPLVRRDVADIVKEINDHTRAYDISLTTNGYLLLDFIDKLKEAGLHRLNVSLHSLQRTKYHYITGVDGLYKVLKGIKEAVNEGFKVKINFTLLKGLNDDEVPSLLHYAIEHGVNVSIIELHPVGKGKGIFSVYHDALDGVKNYIIKNFNNVKILIREQNYREIYVINNGIKVELIRPVDNPYFCLGCNRLRVDCSGGLRICLNDPKVKASLLHIIKSNMDQSEKVEEIAKLILKINRYRKPHNVFNINTTFSDIPINNAINYMKFRVPLIKSIGLGII